MKCDVCETTYYAGSYYDPPEDCMCYLNWGYYDGKLPWELRMARKMFRVKTEYTHNIAVRIVNNYTKRERNIIT